MAEKTRNGLKKWLRNARSVALIQSGVPAVLAVELAFGQSGFNIWLALLAIAGVLCAHLGMNLADDYFDYRADMLSDREKVTRKGFRAMMVKYPYLTDGSVSPGGLLGAISVCFFIGIICGSVIFRYRCLDDGFFGPQGGWWIVAIVAVTAFLGIFYSAPPLKLAHRGFGELVVGVIFGPMLMMGVYYSACGVMSAEVVWISVPVGLLAMNILFTHSFIERESDAASNKMTFARLLGSDRANIIAACVINFLPYVLVVLAVILGKVHPLYLFVLLPVPNSVWLCRSLHEFNKGNTGVPDRPLRRLGPMGDWERVRAAGFDWFHMRWMTSRNILSTFCLVILIVRLILVII